MPKMMLVLLGPPGAGKGTIGELLEKELHIPRLSTGDIIRDEIKAKTPFGLHVQKAIDAGKLVSDEVVFKKVIEHLKDQRFKKGVLFDGFPRTDGQALLLEKKYPPTSVIYLHTNDELLIQRLSNRWVCPKDHEVYNLKTNPPKKAGVCDKDGVKLIQRDDDKPGVIRERLKVYRSRTKELVDFYKDRGLLLKVDAAGTPEQVFKRVMKLLPRKAGR